MFGTPQRVGALKRSTAVVIAGASIAFSVYVNSLGFTFDSRLDYCNALLAVMSEANLDKLKRVQNALARVVTGLHRVTT